MNKIKETLIGLVKAAKEDTEYIDDNIEMLDDVVKSITKYVGAVVSMEYQIPIIIAHKNDPAEIKYLIETLDMNRKRKHDYLIGQINMTNRFAITHNAKPFEVDTNDRHKVAEWAIEFINTFYYNNNKSIEEIEKELIEDQSILKSISLEKIIK